MTIINEQQFDKLVTEVCAQTGLPQTDDTYEAIATVVLHAPPDMGHFNYAYVSDRVLKMVANKIAYDRLQQAKVKREETLKASKAPEAPSNGSGAV